MVKSGEQYKVDITDIERQQAFCLSKESLGHGIIKNISDVVFVKPEQFDPAKTREMAQDINKVNHELEGQNRPYLLAGPGRWGSADPWLGIPVQWQDISGVRAIVELRPPEFKADPSQGSHFFQNITSLGIPYVTISEGEARFDLNWLAKQELINETKYLKHVRIDPNILIKINGSDSECLMMVGVAEKPELNLPMLD
jgi:hypothetical protein